MQLHLPIFTRYRSKRSDHWHSNGKWSSLYLQQWNPGNLRWKWCWSEKVGRTIYFIPFHVWDNKLNELARISTKISLTFLIQKRIKIMPMTSHSSSLKLILSQVSMVLWGFQPTLSHKSRWDLRFRLGETPIVTNERNRHEGLINRSVPSSLPLSLL